MLRPFARGFKIKLDWNHFLKIFELQNLRMSLKRVHTGYENNETYHDSQKIRILIISDPIAAPGASSETQGQSVESGEKAGQRFSSTGKRAPG